jgi:hypothetical protein
MTITKLTLHVFALTPAELITLVRGWTPVGYVRQADGFLYRTYRG